MKINKLLGALVLSALCSVSAIAVADDTMMKHDDTMMKKDDSTMMKKDESEMKMDKMQKDAMMKKDGMMKDGDKMKDDAMHAVVTPTPMGMMKR